ncbi:polar amino acid transport system permease protein [Nitrospirillum viridazoti Y2]|uniref:Glutamate/aspartate import permease protein GltK n=1 Tax=Nitrospirillum amazonense TaxID=28077 RepID=A0A560HZM1_9PROT|nr:ABC transporter permease [Nitrospirillum amazonense]EGY00236.1 polar amino acid transport system permease protein [Nitrospirillum amazonense Y2]TWB51039.1 amino acid ABC transporter membrane protein 2 (PAAT family) [Nitrospirillum amazonense]
MNSPLVTALMAALPQFVTGTWLTVQLVALSLLVGLVLATLVAVMRLSHLAALSWVARGYIYVFRSTPLLVQIFLIYYGLGQFDAVRQSVLWPLLREPYWCAIIAFVLNTGAYTAEIMRGGIEAVPHGQVEAARACGMGGGLLFRRIILPQAFRLALPAYGNEIILMLQGSALASTITLMELTGVAKAIAARTFQPIEVFCLAGAVYLGMSFLITRGVQLAERRLTPVKR